MMATETSFYVTGGTLRHDTPSYVERQADKDLYEGLFRGEFCYVRTSRQMGKSSLMKRQHTEAAPHATRPSQRHATMRPGGNTAMALTPEITVDLETGTQRSV